MTASTESPRWEELRAVKTACFGGGSNKAEQLRRSRGKVKSLSMTATISPDILQHEARLLFVLVDAARLNGIMPSSLAEARWNEAKNRIAQSGDYDREAELLYDLMHDLESAGALSETWIEARWNAVKSRLDVKG